MFLLALLALAAPAPAAAATVPAGFAEDVVYSGLANPTAVRFAPDGRVFVAEKSGLIKVFDSLTDTTPSTFADLRTNVHNYWDRGLLGLALDPNFATRPYVYVLYTHDAAIGGTAPRWGTAGATSDPCPTPPGPTGDGCVVSGRLSRLEAAGSVMTGGEQVLIEDWCQQYPSHSVGSLAFGADGALYVSAGDGASFTFVDYGQDGNPVNPCGDPPGAPGTALAPPSAEGGGLRSQDVRTAADASGLDGAILRVDPNTGAALPTNPRASSTDANTRRIVAYGLRNPFRMTVRPGTNELWIGDVGWNDWEEINRITSPTDANVENFGWPCYEGSGRQAGYDGANLSLCETLYGQAGAVTPPYHAYHHANAVVPGDGCATGSSSIAGLAFEFYEGGSYPDEYDGALFHADYARKCIWAILKGPDGLPDKGRHRVFVAGAAGPVDLQIGPGGDLFYADFDGGTIRRVRSTAPPASTLRVAAEADARVEEQNLATNYGTSYLRAVSLPNTESYARFTVSGLTGAVASARLRLYATSDTLNGPAVYGAANTWSETGLTWSTRPARQTAAVDDEGQIVPNTWVEYDVTSLVSGNGTYTFEIAPTSDDGVNFNSREAASLRPELVLTLASGNAPPSAVAAVTPTSGKAPLTVAYDASGSSDPDAGDVLVYEWDLDGDGAYDDSTATSGTHTYTTAGTRAVRVRVSDDKGGASTSSPITVTVLAGDPPVPSVDAPVSTTTWRVGDTVAFAGSATDAEDGALPPSALTWTLLMQHCPSTCHTHTVQTFTGVAEGSFVAPDHEYPSHLELRLTATDSDGLTATGSVALQPETVPLTLDGDQANLRLSLNGATATAPFTRPVIAGSTNSISAPSPQVVAGTTWEFASWSDGGAATHNVVVDAATVLTAGYVIQPPRASAPPIISGNAREARTLTSSTGTWTGSAPMSFAYAWLRCDGAGANCSAIANATRSSYTLTSADVGFRIRSQVTATNPGGTGTATSAATAAVRRRN